VLSDLEISIEQSGGRVEAEKLPVIEADPVQMRQLFQNLIGNSLKYCSSDVPPMVRIRRGVLSEESNYPCSDGSNDLFCEIIFEDNGIGFEQKYAERIFGIFQRLHGRQTYAGTGIGLAICHKIVERHGGQILAVGKPGEGAVFTVRLPLAQASGITT
jgi:signal transduction histidine kinase